MKSKIIVLFLLSQISCKKETQHQPVPVEDIARKFALQLGLKEVRVACGQSNPYIKPICIITDGKIIIKLRCEEDSSCVPIEKD